MAVEAPHFFLAHRVMGKETELRLYLWMTAVAKLGHLVAADLLMRSFMQLVAGKATQIVEGMNTGMPLGQSRGRGCGMAFEADE